MKQEQINQIFLKHFFLNKDPKPAARSSIETLSKQASDIIYECRAILSLTDDSYTKKCLNQLIQSTAALIKTTSSQDQDKKALMNELLEKSRIIQMRLLSLPSEIHVPPNLSSVSYKLSLFCFYTLALSVSVAIGATFGAWYFNYLTIGYFTDVLALALASVGIPGTCIGLLSYGIYSSQKNPVDEKIRNLTEQVERLTTHVIDSANQEGFDSETDEHGEDPEPLSLAK